MNDLDIRVLKCLAGNSCRMSQLVKSVRLTTPYAHAACNGAVYRLIQCGAVILGPTP